VAASAEQKTVSRTPAAVVDRYVDAFNKGDEDGLAACFADPGFILDGMAPHIWSGSNATRDWHKDAMAEADHLGITDFHMTLGRATHDAVVGDAAYFVAPAILKFKVRGQQVTQSGATLTVALRRADEWRITAWAWTKGAGGGTDDVKQATT
jgi:ketosteroid isomerase-like protein